MGTGLEALDALVRQSDNEFRRLQSFSRGPRNGRAPMGPPKALFDQNAAKGKEKQYVGIEVGKPIELYQTLSEPVC